MKDGWLSVSEVISFPDKPFLMNWARKLALAGQDHNRVSLLGRYAGRIMHYEFQRLYAPCDDPMPKDVVEAYSDHEAVEHGGTAWGKLRAWANLYGFETPKGRGQVQVEIPIEDPSLMVRGRMDCIVGPCLFDWKSSKHLYTESLLELGAYDLIWSHLYPDKPFAVWTIVQCSHDNDIPAVEYGFEESDIKNAGLTFASMVPAVRAYREFEATASKVIAGGRKA
jgi:hypothetical protein